MIRRYKHDCPGDGCAVCELSITEAESLDGNDNFPLSLSDVRADGTWRRGADWHYPLDAQPRD